METLEDLELYFYVACGVTAIFLVLIFMLIGLLFYKVKRLSKGESNQLSRQANMMADFCYTNPAIVPGEELSRRGFSMYNGNISDDLEGRAHQHYASYSETRSKF